VENAPDDAHAVAREACDEHTVRSLMKHHDRFVV
jgi:hypothetical protein